MFLWLLYPPFINLVHKFVFLIWVVLLMLLRGLIILLYKVPRLFWRIIIWGIIFVTQRLMVFVSSVGVPSRRDVMSRLYYFNAFIACFKWSVSFVFSVASYGVTKELSLSWRGSLLMWEN